MAVKDIIPIKYWIPKLDFTVRLGTSQYFKVMYKIYTDDWNNDIGWTVLREQYLVQPDGTTSESDKLVLTNLVENRTYVLRLVDNRSKNFNFKFKTGRNIALGDSPYYNKLLMPGQIYDWYIANMDGGDAPIGTWAGTQANWQVCQMEVQSVEYLKYNAGESIVLNGKTSYISEEPTALGESFPESGLRYFITP